MSRLGGLGDDEATVGGSGTGSDRRRQDWRREQRRIARTEHPDVGADPAVYVRLMHEVDLRFGGGPARADLVRPPSRGSAPVLIRSRQGARLRRGLRTGRQIVRAVQTRLPRRMPGARRYIDL